MTTPEKKRACNYKINLRHAWQVFGDEVINPAAEQRRIATTHLAAWRLAYSAATTKRNGYRNPLNVAHDMAEMSKAAPRGLPCALGRLDFERIAVDALHMARHRGAA